ncbi:hypothetical protein AALB39_08420 [Lachnospiraceae bacterium 54-53]
MKYWEICETDLLTLTLVCDDEALLRVNFGRTEPEDAVRKRTELIEKTEKQLKEYLKGTRREPGRLWRRPGYQGEIAGTGAPGLFMEKLLRILCVSFSSFNPPVHLGEIMI